MLFFEDFLANFIPQAINKFVFGFHDSVHNFSWYVAWNRPFYLVIDIVRYSFLHSHFGILITIINDVYDHHTRNDLLNVLVRYEKRPK